MNTAVEQEVLPPEIKCSIIEYDPIARALADIESRYVGVVYDVTTKGGMEQAKAGRAEIRGYQTNLEAVRTHIKAPHLIKGRAIDSEAREIDERLQKVRGPIEAQIKAQEAAAEEARQAKLQADIARIQSIRALIDGIVAVADTMSTTESAPIRDAIDRIQAMEITEAVYQELTEDATRAKESTLFRLQTLITTAIAAEAEAARIKAERQELARLRQADEDRRANEVAERQREEAETKARRDAEDRARKEVQENEDAERRRIQAEEQAKIDAQRAEQQRVQDELNRQAREVREAEQRRQDAIAAELKAKQDAAEAEERKKREAEAERVRKEEEARDAADRKLREAAPVMLAALISVRDMGNADSPDVWRQVDEAIEKAMS